MKAYRSIFPARIDVKSQEDKPDSDCPRDPDGLISDEQVERDRAQLEAQQYLEEVDAAHLTEPNGDGPKSLAAVREEAREWAFKYMSAAQVKTIEFEVDDA